MSYQIRVESKAGQHTVTVSGDVPEGTHVIRGHFDGISATLSVNRINPAGMHTDSAASSHVEEQ